MEAGSITGEGLLPRQTDTTHCRGIAKMYNEI